MLFSAREIQKAYQLFIGKQALSMVLSLGSVVLIARQIGPAAYGAYFVCITFIDYLVQACQFGMGPYLYREKPESFHESLNSYFGFTLSLSGLLSCLIFLGLFLLDLEDSAAVQAGKWLVFSVPLLLFNNALRVSLEKELKSKEIVISETLAHMAFLLSGGLLALTERGIWAPVVAWWTQNVVLFVCLNRGCSTAPRFRVSKNRLLLMLKSGAPIVGVSLVSGMEGIALTGFTTSKLGLASTGELGLVKRVISRTSFLQVPNARVSNIVCGNHIADKERLKGFVESNLNGTIFSFGFLFLLLAWIPNALFEKVLGKEWGTSYELLPWLCFATFTTSSLYVLQAALIALEAHRVRIVFAGASLLVLIGASLLLMPHFGIRGWAMGEAAASLFWLLLPLALQRKTGRFDWLKPLRLWLVFGVLILLRGLL